MCYSSILRSSLLSLQQQHNKRQPENEKTSSCSWTRAKRKTVQHNSGSDLYRSIGADRFEWRRTRETNASGSHAVPFSINTTPRPWDCSRGTRRLDHVELGFSFDDPAPAADPYRLLLITKQEQSISSLLNLEMFPSFLQFFLFVSLILKKLSWKPRAAVKPKNLYISTVP